MMIRFEVEASLIGDTKVLVNWLNDNVGPSVSYNYPIACGMNWEIHRLFRYNGDHPNFLYQYYLIYVPKEEDKINLLLALV